MGTGRTPERKIHRRSDETERGSASTVIVTRVGKRILSTPPAWLISSTIHAGAAPERKKKNQDKYFVTFNLVREGEKRF